MSIIKTERLTKILSETQAVISECNARGVHGSVEVNARLFENVLMEILHHRAAMPQGAEPVTTVYKLPANTPCKEAPEHIWLQTAGVWPENGEFSELTWCSDNQHEDDTLYVRADVVTGNSPVIPDWQAKAEKLAELHGSSFVVFRNGESPQCADPSKVFISFTDEGLGHGAAAPQQEVKP